MDKERRAFARRSSVCAQRGSERVTGVTSSKHTATGMYVRAVGRSAAVPAAKAEARLDDTSE